MYDLLIDIDMGMHARSRHCHRHSLQITVPLSLLYERDDELAR